MKERCRGVGPPSRELDVARIGARPLRKRQTGDRAEGMRVGSVARLHSEDDDHNNRMSVPLRQQLCVSAVRGSGEQIGHCEVPTAAECHSGTVVSHSRSREQFKGWRAGKVQAAAV